MGIAMGDLGQRLARGEPAAFAELYDACAEALHHYLVVHTGSRHDADDVLQETFVRLARAPRKLSHIENLTAYVFAAARNEAARLMSGRSRELRERAALATRELYVEGAGDAASQRETAEALVAALARLAPLEREVVELKLHAGLTLAEIAAVTGAPPGTVATRWRAAVGRLKQWLSKPCHD